MAPDASTALAGLLCSLPSSIWISCHYNEIPWWVLTLTSSWTDLMKKDRFFKFIFVKIFNVMAITGTKEAQILIESQCYELVIESLTLWILILISSEGESTAVPECSLYRKPRVPQEWVSLNHINLLMLYTASLCFLM